MCSFNHIVHDGAVFWCIALEVDRLCIALELLVCTMYIMQQRVGGTISGPVLIANFGSLFAKMDYRSVIVQRRVVCSTVHRPCMRSTVRCVPH